MIFFFFSSRRRHTRLQGDWSSDVCSSDLAVQRKPPPEWTNVSLGIVLEAVDASYDPPPVRKTTPVGNPLAVPLNPKPCLLPERPFEKLGTSEAAGDGGRSPQPAPTTTAASHAAA